MPSVLRPALILTSLLALGCAAEDGVGPDDDRADDFDVVFEAGALSPPFLTDQEPTELMHEDFSSGVYRFHKWDVFTWTSGVVRVAITTYNTFEPFLEIEYLPTDKTASVRASVTSANGLVLTDAAIGRYEATLVISARQRSESMSLRLSSVDAARSGDAVAERATYDIQLLGSSYAGLAAGVTST
jgi:hypothetical protein